MIPLHSIKKRKRVTSKATDAGKDIELSAISEFTPKHASRIIKIPIGTYSQALKLRCHESWATFTLYQPCHTMECVRLSRTSFKAEK
jgi:hypothetical protein